VIAVIGSTGQLGSAFMRLLGGEATPVSRRDIDLCDPDRLSAWFGP
jgi:dTDP-4-dehydrorhamnose reductase